MCINGLEKDNIYKLIRDLGKPDFEYEASEVKRWNYQAYRKTKKNEIKN